eukprot:6491520-Prymnesium_polylepis.1
MACGPDPLPAAQLGHRARQLGLQDVVPADAADAPARGGAHDECTDTDPAARHLRRVRGLPCRARWPGHRVPQPRAPARARHLVGALRRQRAAAAALWAQIVAGGADLPQAGEAGGGEGGADDAAPLRVRRAPGVAAHFRRRRREDARDVQPVHGHDVRAERQLQPRRNGAQHRLQWHVPAGGAGLRERVAGRHRADHRGRRRRRGEDALLLPSRREQ